MKYTPTPGPLPGEQWTPSNGDMGLSFLSDWCSNCARDKPLSEGIEDGEQCPIIAASFRNEAVEWREVDGEVKCIAFVPAGQEVKERCSMTGELF